MRLLLVEDDALLARAVCAGLGQTGWAVDWTSTARQAEGALRAYAYDGMVMDLGLPDMDGLLLVRRLRAGGRFHGPVIVISARAKAQDRVELLDLGADDYLVKPFDLDELAARFRAVLRRAPQREPRVDELWHDALRLLPARRLALWNGNEVTLTHKEYGLLEALLRRKHQVVSRSQLEETLYGWDDDVDSNTVEVYVHHLRRKFGPGLIRTVRGAGYCIGQEA